MSLLEQLKAEFPTRVCPPYGLCLVIPGDMFHPNWEGELDVDVINTDFGDPNKPVTLIPLKEEQATKKQFEDSTPTSSTETPQSIEYSWRDEEFALLIKLWSKQPRLTLKEITREFGKKFGNRTDNAVKDALDRLKRKGKIQSRWTFKRGKHKEEKSKTEDMPRGISAVVPVISEEKMKKLAKEIKDRPVATDTFIRGDMKKIIDKQPILEYQGRHILIKSDGTPAGTHIFVNGQEAPKVINLTLSLAVGRLSTVEMTMYDF